MNSLTLGDLINIPSDLGRSLINGKGELELLSYAFPIDTVHALLFDAKYERYAWECSV